MLNAVGDYINELVETGEMTDEEEELMRRHPRIVADGEGFREFFAPYVKKLVRDKRADRITARPAAAGSSEARSNRKPEASLRCQLYAPLALLVSDCSAMS